MLASELIEALRQAIAEVGDVEVRDEDGYALAGADGDEDADSGEVIITIVLA